MYRLLECGPDNRSTYAECWGSMATSKGREIAAEERLIDLYSVIRNIGHDNWGIYDPDGKLIMHNRKQFYERFPGFLRQPETPPKTDDFPADGQVTLPISESAPLRYQQFSHAVIFSTGAVSVGKMTRIGVVGPVIDSRAKTQDEAGLLAALAEEDQRITSRRCRS